MFRFTAGPRRPRHAPQGRQGRWTQSWRGGGRRLGARAGALSLLAALGPVGAARAAHAPVPFSHVFVIVLENHGEEQVIGNPALPALNRLARQGALAVNNHGVAHPSLPNYVALLAGTTFGSRSDDPTQTFTGPTLPDRLERAGLSWKGYFQSMPGPGYAGPSAGTLGVYVKRHNPFMLFPAIAAQPARAARTVPLPQLDADLRAGRAPNFALIVPDNCHNMHRNLQCLGPAELARDADQFVSRWVSAIEASSAWDNRAAIVITFDEAEGDDHRGGGGRIPLIVLTRTGPRAVQSARAFNHYSLLRTLTGAWTLPPLGESAHAPTMNELFFR